MVLISVDLPAPLSPSSPSTSPFLRCRLTSLSAVTGPKRLEMCSTRSTSSDAGVGPTTSVFALPSSATGPVSSARTRDVDVGGHCDDDRQPGVEEQVVG